MHPFYSGTGQPNLLATDAWKGMDMSAARHSKHAATGADKLRCLAARCAKPTRMILTTPGGYIIPPASCATEARQV